MYKGILEKKSLVRCELDGTGSGTSQGRV